MNATTKATSIRSLPRFCKESHGLSAMSRAHREILHLARLLARVAEDLPSEKVDRYLIRDAQRIIEAIETLVRMHTAQEEDIYEAVAAKTAASAVSNRRRAGSRLIWIKILAQKSVLVAWWIVSRHRRNRASWTTTCFSTGP